MTTGTPPPAPATPTIVYRSPWHVAAAIVLMTACASCGQLQRQGQGSSYLIVSALEGASGADPGAFGGTLGSDVITVVDDIPTVFSDLGRVTLTLAMKDPGGAGLPTTPTSANFITLQQYHVRYIRSDGRNTQGVDVPYSFDGAMTLTVATGDVIGAFTIVRHIAKQEAPLRALAVNGTVISTIAEVTFYGRDQTGREVSATARISIDFANFGDKA